MIGTTDEADQVDEGRRIALNRGLWIVALVCAAAVIVLAGMMWNLHSSDSGGFGARLGHTITDQRDEPVAGIGDDVGKGVVQALPAAEPADQQRVSDILESSSKMVTAFLNVDWQHIDADVAAVRSMTTGDFRKQYDKSTKSLRTLTARTHSVEKGEVTWAGYVGGDADSATVILATNGTVSSNQTKHQPVVRSYRIQVDLQKSGDRWLVDNVQFVS